MSDELIGGRYRIIDSLRNTGFCKTYPAEDLHLPENPYPRCVVKKLQPQSSENFVLETARRLFESEAKVLYKQGQVLLNPDYLPTSDLLKQVEEKLDRSQ